MNVLKIVCILLGVAFLVFGYFIYFKRKFNLINGFAEDFTEGRKNEQYALRVGMLEFVAGVILLIIGIVLCIFL